MKPCSLCLTPKKVAMSVNHLHYAMVWGSIGYGAVTELIILPRNQIISKCIICSWMMFLSSSEHNSASVFQQDGAPTHTTKLIKEWFVDCSRSWRSWTHWQLKNCQQLSTLFVKASIPNFGSALPTHAMNHLKVVVKKKGFSTKYLGWLVSSIHFP